MHGYLFIPGPNGLTNNYSRSQNKTQETTVATEKDSKGYPKIAKANWFGLRDKLKQRVPVELSASYVASAMNMAEGSARSNVVAPLKALGIIGEDNKPSDLAYDWRDDKKYAEVCEKIIEAVYPQELRDLFHDPSATLEELTSWFMRSAKVGEPAAKMYARTYLMLLEADPAKADEVQKQPKQKSEKPTKETPKKEKKAPSTAGKKEGQAFDGDGESSFSPRLHIDVQVHISPDSSPEQIDKIFEAMSKHLKGFKS